MTRSDSELVRVHPALVHAHRADRAAPADIQRAYLRFTWARRKAPPRPVLRWLFAGMAIGLGVASAATVIQQPSKRSSSPSQLVEAAGPAKAKARASGRAAAKHASEEAKALPEPLPVASAKASEAAAAQPAASTSSVPWPHSAPPSSALPSMASAASSSEWQRAAAALRGGDLSAAEAALSKLSQSESPSDRQAAELARAQLLVERGRVAEAIPTLQRLAREGGSTIIRSQAASLLRTLGQ